jgi:hypothetical protein
MLYILHLFRIPQFPKLPKCVSRYQRNNMLGYEIFREGERNYPNTLPNRELGGKWEVCMRAFQFDSFSILS